MSISNEMSRETAAEKQNERASEAAALTKKIRRAEASVKDYQFFILRLALFIVVLWLLLFVFIGVTHMPSTDMYPRIDAGDFVMFYRLDKDVKAQDIIVFRKEVPGQAGEHSFICRVVAVAGDTVDITDENRLLINGNAVVEPNIFYMTSRYEGYTEFPLTLEEGECFVLADSRNGGTDSRVFGPVSKSEIEGTVITIVRRNNL